MAQTDSDDLVGILEGQEGASEIPPTLPLLPVRDVVIFTQMVLPLFVGRDKSVRAVDTAMARDRYIFLAAQKDPGIENPTQDQIFELGTAGRILRCLKLPDGRVKVLVQGLVKARIVSFVRHKLLFRVKIEKIEEIPFEGPTLEIEALVRNVREQCEKILNMRGEYTDEVASILDGIDHPGRLADIVASNLRLKISEAQGLLEIMEPVARLHRINELLSREVELSTMQARIQSHVQDEISKSQKDYFLREQMRAIHKELGETDERSQEVLDYTRKIKRAKMPREAAEEAMRQIRRLEQMHPDSAEAPVVRGYLDWIVELPWNKSTKDTLDIKKAKEVLDADHFGLTQIKDRILEYLSVRKLNPRMKGPILCFVGPPGVGKTSLGQSIARAMCRKFVRISLGGIRDEAEIRGHRRTYIGAMPGRIIQGLKQCGANNPVFMMDEIDKVGSDFRGDPTSALLEALDPEQNNAFSDHYLNMPFDLSSVLFITTANITDTIPPALLDRMELITLSGYTDTEKIAIARKYLIPRQIKENGLKAKNIQITTGALELLATEYTCESGLRNLERELATLCRKVSRRIAEGEKGPFKITPALLKKFLGLPKYSPEMDQDAPQVGLATGLAWTQAGGEALYIEAMAVRGKGELHLTGQLGEVMAESARAAVTFARSRSEDYGIPKNFFDTHDLHIHVPAGAIPKDGPSAGVAMCAALVSLMSNRPVSHDVAMTGEITIRGRVLPIGGLKEKAIGALRAGIRTIVIPEKNRKELSELPALVKRRIRFVPITDVLQALEISLLPSPQKTKPKSGPRPRPARPA